MHSSGADAEGRVERLRHAPSVRDVVLARPAGALTVLRATLSTRIAVQLNEGDLARAASLAQEQRSIAETTGSRLVLGLIITATRGPEPQASMELTITPPWSALLHNGFGQYEEAFAATWCSAAMRPISNRSRSAADCRRPTLGDGPLALYQLGVGRERLDLGLGPRCARSATRASRPRSRSGR